MSAKFFIPNKMKQIAMKRCGNSQEKSIGFVMVNAMVSGEKKTKTKTDLILINEPFN